MLHADTPSEDVQLLTTPLLRGKEKNKNENMAGG
jgi:hypothetical protein